MEKSNEIKTSCETLVLTTNNVKNCSICLNEMVCQTMLSCKHNLFCVFCINKVFVGSAGNKVCPLCRCNITSQPILIEPISQILNYYNAYIWVYKSNNFDTYWLYDPDVNRTINDNIINNNYMFDISIFPGVKINIKIDKPNNIIDIIDEINIIESVKYLFDDNLINDADNNSNINNDLNFNLSKLNANNLTGTQKNYNNNWKRLVKCFKKDEVLNSLMKNEKIFLGVACAVFK